ncbi:dickkopf-related protein 2 isoform X3 [Mastomys coucha]|uniref:dickkopf-related protein 2 isoform X3 n=1 Tax=Mastomys coucha TaxID=35658 RepID=UPI001262A09B|nr:dickkopf-related protein 2 isoform X3 [Mastomys coucha]
MWPREKKKRAREKDRERDRETEGDREKKRVRDRENNSEKRRKVISHVWCQDIKWDFIMKAYPCSSDKECEVGRYCHSPHQGSSACMVCRRKKKRCHRDGMCCPGTRCNNGICIPVTESILTPHIPALDGTRHRDRNHGHYSNHDLGWQNLGRPHSKMPHIKGHEGDPCLRSSDCIDGFCCARHFWTKICKPVLHQGEVCTKQRKKGSHGLEIFQRCDCAKGLSCKVWKDATYSSKARLHVCQKI